MRPHHRLLDVGCGSLRGGVRFIEYLEPGNYYGLEPSMPLLGAGISIELPLAGIGPDKRPRFLINDDFDLSELPPNVRFDYAFANSVFTHLPPDRIEQSTRTVLERLTPQGKFFATFYMAKKRDLEGPPRPWIGNARYPAKEIKSMVEAAGGQAKFIGDWEHARKEQRMWCITKAE